MSEIEFLGALEVELSRHADLRPEHHEHEAFQTSTIQALLGGAFEGDVTLGELLAHGDLGLGTLDGLDGELIVLDGQLWKANVDGTVTKANASARTPYAVVVEFSPGESLPLRGNAELEHRLAIHGATSERPTAIRIDGRFESVRVRSVPKQTPPYPSLAEAISRQRVTELHDVSGTMVGFCFPQPLDGITMIGMHLHFVTDDRARGGHVLGYTLLEATAYLDAATRFHVELPPAVDVPAHGAAADQGLLERLESDV